MSPKLRSSAPSSPMSPISKGSTRTPSQTPPRKAPCCTKCGRPRAGHPRSGCPYTEKTQSPEPGIAEALGSLQLIGPVDDKNAVRARHRSLELAQTPGVSVVPVSSISSRDLELISQPSRVREESPDDGLNQRMRRIVRWQETLEVIADRPPPDPPLRGKSVMPGTLLTPDSSMFGSPACSPPPPDRQPTAHDHTPIPVTGSTGPRSLARSLSVQEREAFLNGLVESTQAPPASVFTIPMDEIYRIQHSAAKLGFHSRIVAGEDNSDGWLILGSDDKAVQMLFEGVNGKRKARKQSAPFHVAATGAVVGAVATFTGLAFS
jgi:hypothetical protein